ncbi:hypothetical protein CTAYLR_008182 [Chrysophaeum taylorii]|uniref:EF-hand domain-containing protein n=1 Tax=Chrysophaeum taylorii TaxID=2483200 RepID=A0AAD7U984_9STRA|nr:hypothetical protein CTAYLR_008182 [Chrysophaeum taylorii]
MASLASIKGVEKQRAMAIHKHKLQKASSTIDTKVPNSMLLPHVRRNWKREKIDEEKYQDIERDNSILVARMQRIMNGGDAASKLSPYVQNSAAAAVHKPTLNYRVRKARDLQIQEENKAIIKRLRASKSDYSRENLKPTHFHPHFLPRLALPPRAMGSSSSSTVKERALSSSTSIQTARSPHHATDHASVLSGVTLGSISARAADSPAKPPTTAERPTPPQPRSPPPPHNEVFTPIKTRSSRLLSISSQTYPRLDSFHSNHSTSINNEPCVLIREALKCRGKYVVASIKQPRVLPDLWDVEFYVPDDAVTYTTQLSVDAAARWLGISRSELVADASAPDVQSFQSRRSSNQSRRTSSSPYLEVAPPETETRQTNLKAILRCYDLIPQQQQQQTKPGENASSSSSSTLKGGKRRTSFVPMLTHKASDVVANMCDNAAKNAQSRFAADYSSKLISSTVNRTSSEMRRCSMSTIESMSQITTNAAEKIQVALKRATFGGAVANFFRRKADGHGTISSEAFRRLVRRDGKLSPRAVTDAEADVVFALLADDGSKLLRLKTLIEFVTKGSYNSVVFSTNGRKKVDALNATLAAMSEDDLDVSETNSEPTQLPSPDKTTQETTTTTTTTKCAAALEVAKEQRHRPAGGPLSTPRRIAAVTAPYAAPPSMLLAPSSYKPRKIKRAPDDDSLKAAVSWCYGTSPHLQASFAALSNAASRSDGVLTRSDVVRVIREDLKTSQEDLSDRELEKLLGHLELDAAGCIPVGAIQKLLSDDTTVQSSAAASPRTARSTKHRPERKGVAYRQNNNELQRVIGDARRPRPPPRNTNELHERQKQPRDQDQQRQSQRDESGQEKQQKREDDDDDEKVATKDPEDGKEEHFCGHHEEKTQQELSEPGPPSSWPLRLRRTRQVTGPEGRHLLMLNACASSGLAFAREVREAFVLMVLSVEARLSYENARKEGKPPFEAFTDECVDCILRAIVVARSEKNELCLSFDMS